MRISKIITAVLGVVAGILLHIFNILGINGLIYFPLEWLLSIWGWLLIVGIIVVLHVSSIIVDKPKMYIIARFFIYLILAYILSLFFLSMTNFS